MSPQDNLVSWLSGPGRQVGNSHRISPSALPTLVGTEPYPPSCPGRLVALGLLQTTVFHNHRQVHVPSIYHTPLVLPWSFGLQDTPQP